VGITRKTIGRAACPVALLTLVCTSGGGHAQSAADGWYEVSAETDVLSTAESAGWTELPSSDPAHWSADRAAPEATSGAPTSATGVGNTGDRLWVMRPGDTLAAISRATTGTVDHAERIGAYNRLAAGSTPGAERLLFVPAELLPSPAPSVARSEIRELGSGGGGPAGENTAERDGKEARRSVVAKIAPPSLERRDVDLFVGEVRVLGEVDVSRVAIGNGGVIRAEVLDTGELLVIGQSAGSTSLHLWHKEGRQSSFNLRVSEHDPQTRVRMERMVRMRVRLVEFKKNALGKLGVDWSDSVAGPTLASAGDIVSNSLYRPVGEGFAQSLPRAVAPFSTYFGVASNITSRINLLASNGDARTLAEPVLSSVNGGSASFLAGGEVPYPSVGSNGQTLVQFKEYGVKLDIAPLIDAAGNVRTRIETEISSIDPAVSVQGAPGLITRRAETQVNVRSGETIVISGLLSEESSRAADRVPGLGRLPVIGSLFRSRDYRNAVTELVVFVTPEVVEPAGTLGTGRERQLFADTTRRLEDARGAVPLME